MNSRVFLDLVITHLTYSKPTTPTPSIKLPLTLRDKNEENYRLELWEKPTINDYRELYLLVGKRFLWWERIAMEDEELQKKIDPNFTTIVRLFDGDTIIGFAEWTIHQDSHARYIAYFGLAEGYEGKGIGSQFMDTLRQLIWQESSSLNIIHLNTCTLDHPNALAFYQHKGFVKSHTENLSFPDPRGVFY